MGETRGTEEQILPQGCLDGEIDPWPLTTLYMGLKTKEPITLEYARNEVIPSVLREVAAQRPHWQLSANIEFDTDMGQTEDDLFKLTATVFDHHKVL